MDPRDLLVLLDHREIPGHREWRGLLAPKVRQVRWDHKVMLDRRVRRVRLDPRGQRVLRVILVRTAPQALKALPVLRV